MTAARTEASKIRNDARSASFEESGVRYVEYVTAGDEVGKTRTRDAERENIRT